MDENKKKGTGGTNEKRKCSREILLVLKCGLEADLTQIFHASPRPQNCNDENKHTKTKTKHDGHPKQILPKYIC